MREENIVFSKSILKSSKNEKPTVLVVDSDTEFLNSFRILLASENCEMIQASSSDEAIKKIEGRQIDLLITDFMLKSKSSIELLILIRKSYPNVPILVMTEHSDIITTKDVKMFGGNELLSKPLESSRLRSMIRNYCNELLILN